MWGLITLGHVDDRHIVLHVEVSYKTFPSEYQEENYRVETMRVLSGYWYKIIKLIFYHYHFGEVVTDNFIIYDRIELADTHLIYKLEI